MKGNYLYLTPEQLKIFNDRYNFTVIKEGILTTTTSYKRITVHPFNESFQVIAVIDGKKHTLKITTDAINLWLKPKYKSKSLIDIQNAINKTIIESQNITEKDIINALN